MVVQPYDMQALNQQVLGQDRLNRDQELAIRGLIEDNDKLIRSTLAHQQDEGLAKIDQTIQGYRDALLSRDRARIEANGEKRWSSRYGDLIALTEDADDMTVPQELANKSGLLTAKFQMLTELRDEMVALNDKLNNRKGEISSQNETTISGFEKLVKEQQDKIQMLTQQLVEMDKKIAHYDEIINEKDEQIARLKDDLDRAKSDLAEKDDRIKQLSSSVPGGMAALAPIVVNASNKQSQPEPILVNKNTISLPPIIVDGSEEEFNDQKTVYAHPQDEIAALRNKINKLSLNLKGKDDYIRWLMQVLAVAKKKAEYYQLGSQLSQPTPQAMISAVPIQVNLQAPAKNDLLKLAKQLIGLQEQEASLLDEKGGLVLRLNTMIDKHVTAAEGRIKVLLEKHRIQDIDLQDRIDELQNDLNLKKQEIDLLKQQLEERIAKQKDQEQLQREIHDLRAQLHDKTKQISALKSEIKSGQETQDQLGALKQQLADQQNKMDFLKEELASKAAESDKMTSMIDDYQKKLESKDNAYNEQLRQVLSSKNYQAQMEKQIANFSTQLQDKEEQLVKIKMDLSNLQNSTNAKDKDQQANDLSVSVMQQTIKSLKTELALTHQQLAGMPSSDEIVYLRTGFKKATLELKQKDAMLLQIKANADEYEKEFKAQTEEFKSLKEQLQDAYDQVNRKNEDLKYKNLEVVRLKERFAVKQGDLQDQIKALTKRVDIAEKEFMKKTHGTKVQALQAQLKSANLKMQDLQNQVNQLKAFSKNEPAGEKLKQAFDKIDEQGRLINVLAQKLQECGQTVDARDINKE